jgi:tRNA (cmo5U34)-methyltransferase
MDKSTIDEIRERFDNDVERFSDLDTGQVTTIDAKLTLELITEAARRINPSAQHLLDIGCGAGNYTLTMLSKMPSLECTLVDLSQPMLDRALQRVSAVTTRPVVILQGDIRTIELPANHYDIILAGAVLHHLRDDKDWEETFRKIFGLLKPGGCFMISDLVIQDTQVMTDYTMERYGDYLQEIGGKDYRRKVLDYVNKEDSPRSITYQLQLMRKIGFRQVEVFHKNICFGAFGGIK